MKRGLPPSVHDEDVLGKAYDAKLIGRLWRYVRPHGGLVSLSLLLMLAVGAVQLVQPYLIKLAIDDHISTRRMEGLGILALLFLSALACEFGLRFGQMYVLERTGQNVVLDMRGELFAHVQRLDSSFFDRNPVGRIMTRLTTDVEALNEAFTSGLIVILAVTCYCTLGNFAIFFEIASAAYLDGSRERIRLLPFTLLGFLVSLASVTRATFTAVFHRRKGERLVWHKTEHPSGRG